MRTQLFILGLIAVSFVSATSFQSKLAEPEFAAQVEAIKAKENMGSIILSMAELETDQGRFVVLFRAIDDLSAFLVHDRAVENQSYAVYVASYHQQVAALTAKRNLARRSYRALNALLRNALLPRRRNLIKYIGVLEQSLRSVRRDLASLRAFRKAQVAVYQAQSSDFVAAINSLKQAQPLLKSLANGQSFAELDADVFAQVSTSLKQTLGKLSFGEVHTVFVDSLLQMLSNKNFVNQGSLLKVIGLIQRLQQKLEQGLVTLNNNEALNLKNFNQNQAAALRLIRSLKASIALNKSRLVRLNKRIASTRQSRNSWVAVYKKTVNDLIVVNKQMVQRSLDHKQSINEVNAEEATVAEAVRVLNAGGVNRNA